MYLPNEHTKTLSEGSENSPSPQMFSAATRKDWDLRKRLDAKLTCSRCPGTLQQNTHESSNLSTMYLMIVSPPLYEGADQLKINSNPFFLACTAFKALLSFR